MPEASKYRLAIQQSSKTSSKMPETSKQIENYEGKTFTIARGL